MIAFGDVVADFEAFDLPSHDPKWSSWFLERFIEKTLSQTDGTLTNLFRGFSFALKKHNVKLTETVANLVTDIVKTAFALHKVAFTKTEWRWAIDELATKATPAQCYLFMLALPSDYLTHVVTETIMQGLEGTPQHNEAIVYFSDNLENKGEIH